MARFRHTLFVCTNDRPADDPRGSCKARGAEGLLSRMKELTAEHGLKGKIRVTGTGCLDLCAKGCTVAAFSDVQGPARETWYTRLAASDAERLFRTHIIEGALLTDKVEQVHEKNSSRG